MEDKGRLNTEQKQTFIVAEEISQNTKEERGKNKESTLEKHRNSQSGQHSRGSL